MNDQDEMFEAATETPAFLGCPALGPKQLPGGSDGVEPAEKVKGQRSEVSNEELKKRGSKLKACNDRSHERVAEIAHLANECLLNTNHPNGYEPGQYGQDYRTFGKAMCAIRKIIRDSFADVDPDYEMLALQFARNSFDFSKFQEAMAAVASMKETDFPGFYYTPGWLVELAKKLEKKLAKKLEPAEKKHTMDFGRFHVTRAAIPGKTVLTFRRKQEVDEKTGSLIIGRIIIAEISKKDVGCEKLSNNFVVKSYMPGEKPHVLFSGDSWVCMSKTEKMVYKMVKTDVKETHRRRILRKRKAAAAKQQADDNKAAAGEVK